MRLDVSHVELGLLWIIAQEDTPMEKDILSLSKFNTVHFVSTVETNDYFFSWAVDEDIDLYLGAVLGEHKYIYEHQNGI